MSIFTSFRPRLVGQPAQNSPEMALALAREHIEAIKERKAEAEAAERACEPMVETTPQDQEHYDVLEALLKGRHRPVILPLLLESFPELITPAGDLQLGLKAAP